MVVQRGTLYLNIITFKSLYTSALRLENLAIADRGLNLTTAFWPSLCSGNKHRTKDKGMDKSLPEQSQKTFSRIETLPSFLFWLKLTVNVFNSVYLNSHSHLLVSNGRLSGHTLPSQYKDESSILSSGLHLCVFSLICSNYIRSHYTLPVVTQSL